MWYKNVGTSWFRFVTIHTFDRHTDGRTERPWQYRALDYMQSLSKNSRSFCTEWISHETSRQEHSNIKDTHAATNWISLSIRNIRSYMTLQRSHDWPWRISRSTIARSGHIILWKLNSTLGMTCFALNGQRFVCFAVTGLFCAQRRWGKLKASHVAQSCYSVIGDKSSLCKAKFDPP